MGGPTFLPDRFVAFLDILGFTAQVEAMRRPGGGAAIARAWRVLARLDALERDWGQLRSRPAAGVSTFQVTAFSDNIVMSDDSPFGIVVAVQHLTAQLLEEGLLCRGGIARGPTYHKDRVVFGPGMIDAYDLERRAASVPRVLVAPNVAPELSGDIIHSEPFLATDSDGLQYVSIFKRVSNVRTGPATQQEAEHASLGSPR